MDAVLRGFHEKGLSYLIVGPFAMGMVFNGYEIAALLFTALITVALTSDGESTWFEGVQLIAVYVLLGLVFYFA